MIKLVLFETFALALLYSCFCRASFTSKANTRRDIRWSFTSLGVMAIVCAVAPLLDYDPDPLATALLGVMAVTQLTTAYHWRRGVPAQFRKDAP